MMDEPREHKYEYDHYDLGYGLHYGVHSLFGEHVAIGTGASMVHLYPYKIFIGDDKENVVLLTPAQQRVMRNMFKAVARRIEAARLQPQHQEGSVAPESAKEKPDAPA